MPTVVNILIYAGWYILSDFILPRKKIHSYQIFPQKLYSDLDKFL